MNEAIRKKIKAQKCMVCPPWKSLPVDACHVRSKGAGGPDDEWNLVPQCRAHHSEQHRLGWARYLHKYPQGMAFLKSMGWEWNDVFGIQKLWHPRLAIEKKDSCI